MKVKLFQSHSISSGYYDDYVSVLTQGVSEWEEVTEEEYEFINRNLHLFKRSNYGDLILVAQPDINVPDVIVSIKQELAKIQKAELKKKEEAKRKRDEAAARKAAKAKEKEIEQLKKLQEKYGTEV